jgi:two-component system, NarL family, nitrate/nitrite response regulator NarL
MMDADRIRVLLADDDALFREGTAELLRRDPALHVVGLARDAAEAVKKASILRPDVVLLDLSMPLGGGLHAARQIRAERPDRAVCILTVSESERDFFSSLRAGVRGYLVKDITGEELCAVVHTLAGGGSVFAPQLATRLLERLAALADEGSVSQAANLTLTAREHEVLCLIGAGYSNHEIGRALSITANTAKVHVRHVLEKLRLRNRHQAAAFAVQHGFLHQRSENGEPVDVRDAAAKRAPARARATPVGGTVMGTPAQRLTSLPLGHWAAHHPADREYQELARGAG